MQHGGALHPGSAGSLLKIHLCIAGNYTYEIPRATRTCRIPFRSRRLTYKDKGLEHPADILAKAFRHMGRRKVIRIHLVRYKAVFNPGLVQKPCYISLNFLLSHKSE